LGRFVPDSYEELAFDHVCNFLKTKYLTVSNGFGAHRG